LYLSIAETFLYRSEQLSNVMLKASSSFLESVDSSAKGQIDAMARLLMRFV
jgi:hypothetical protein